MALRKLQVSEISKEKQIEEVNDTWIGMAGRNAITQVEINHQNKALVLHIRVKDHNQFVDFRTALQNKGYDCKEIVKAEPTVQTNMGIFDKDRFIRLKRAYEENLKQEITQFEFEWHIWVRAYAFYMLHYLSPLFGFGEYKNP